jgi:2-phosphoglycerate kinase
LASARELQRGHSGERAESIGHVGQTVFVAEETLLVPAPLHHVYWIGGGSGAGKTTIASRIAAARGLRVYSTDDAMTDHTERSAPADAPYLAEFKSMTMDERWLNRTPQTMLETFHWFRGEAFGLIVEDLLRMSTDIGVIAEGFRLLPHLVKPLLADTCQAVWLLPTPEFRREAFAHRAPESDYTRKTSNPERARTNVLERERMFTDHLRVETKRLDLSIVEVHPAMSENDLASAVMRTFGL